MGRVYDAIVVGGGIAGLTAAVYLSKAGKSVLLCEKEEKCGGLVNTFERDGFFYDGGVRALENSGILFPMLKQLGIHLEYVPNVVSIGIEDRIITLEHKNNLQTYESLLKHFYPENQNDIDQIIRQMQIILNYMDVQYGIDNPIFLELKANRAYLIKVVLPWLIKHAIVARKIARIIDPTVDFLKRYTRNQGLIDIIAQHFFRDTPAYFALSYMKLYEDYIYPRGGTGSIVSKLVEMALSNKAEIRNNTRIVELDFENQFVKDSRGDLFYYRRIVWAADQTTLYRVLKTQNIGNEKVKRRIAQKTDLISNKSGNDSVYSMFVGVNLDREYFAKKCTGHLFYTPDRAGQSSIGPIPYDQDRVTTEKWLKAFLNLTTYEISIPVLRDGSMAPAGKTGLIISFLFDYKLTRQIENQGWYTEFKDLCEKTMVQMLERTIFPGLAASIQHIFSSTPITMQKMTGNFEGAITGWAFSNHPVPTENRLIKILESIQTPVPGVYQAGQWTFSPSGFPVSLLTGKVAADHVIKDLK